MTTRDPSSLLLTTFETGHVEPSAVGTHRQPLRAVADQRLRPRVYERVGLRRHHRDVEVQAVDDVDPAAIWRHGHVFGPRALGLSEHGRRHDRVGGRVDHVQSLVQTQGRDPERVDIRLRLRRPGHDRHCQRRESHPPLRFRRFRPEHARTPPSRSTVRQLVRSRTDGHSRDHHCCLSVSSYFATHPMRLADP